MVRLIQAEKILGITSAAIGQSRQYRPFLRKTDNRRVTYFDIDAYLIHRKALEQAYTEVTLLIEYIGYFHKEITKVSLSKMGGCKAGAISSHFFSGEVATLILNGIKNEYGDVYQEFLEYYR
jgi:hypothetical protein